jgi:large subunit ribosomal protein L7/L12
MAAKLKEKSAKSTVPKSVGKLVDEISKLSVMELAQLVDTLQDKLGVTPQVAPLATGAAAGQAATPAEVPPEAGAGGGGATQTVAITAAGNNKIAVIKAIREINQNIGLKEAKDMTENLPAEILKDAKADDAKQAAEKLKTAGATVESK